MTVEVIGITIDEEDAAPLNDLVPILTVLSLELNDEGEEREPLMCNTVENIEFPVSDILVDTRCCVEVTLDVDKFGCDVLIWFALLLGNRLVVMWDTVVDVNGFLRVDETNCESFNDVNVKTDEVEYRLRVSLRLFDVFIYDWSVVADDNNPVDGATVDLKLLFEMTVNLRKLES